MKKILFLLLTIITVSYTHLAQCVRIPAEVISPGVLLAKLNIII